MDSHVLLKRKQGAAVLRKTCMNCGKTLSGDAKNLYARRFCSIKCKQVYFGEDMDLKDA